ncbi:coilin-like [Euwallacea similis]|uniref:coilin-like n=1 Tax=Euwallacea similis TaxID=1736056 RepID=UPI00344B5B20
MSSNSNFANIFTVTLDLSKYYKDYRKFTIILIKDTFKTIHDVKQHIENLFKIKDFYLTIAQHYLPAAEDVRILHSQKIVCVHPLNQIEAAYELFNNISTPENIVPNTPTKRQLEEPPNSTDKENIDYKKHKTDGQALGTNLSNNNTPSKEDLSKTEISVPVSTPKTVVDSVLENKQNQEGQEIVNQEALTPLKPNKTHISEVGSTLPETAVRLSRQADNAVQQYTKYIPPQRITDEHISKKRVNIVKVEYLTKPGVAGNDKVVPSDHSSKRLSECSEDFPKENYVKIMISEFEKVIPSGKVEVSPENHKEEASNYTQIYLNQKAANTSCTNPAFSGEKTNLNSSEPKKRLDKVLQMLKHDANPQLSATDLSQGTFVEDDVISLPSSGSFNMPVVIGSVKQNETCSFKNPEPISGVLDGTEENNLNDLNNLNGTRISEICLDCSYDSVTHNISTASQESNPTNDILKPAKDSKIRKPSTGFGIGSFLEELRDISSVLSQESDVSSIEHVKKRKRLRKRVRKSKSKVEPLFIPTKHEISIPEITPNTHRVHIRFDDQGRAINQDEEGSVEALKIDEKSSVSTESEKYNVPTENEKSSIAPQVEAMPIANEKDVLMEDKPIFTVENIENSPSMKDRLEPKVGDIIAFKILKISENYTPQLSSLIIGKVANYASEVVSFKILSGMQEFANPTGKFFIDLDVKAMDVEPGCKELRWENVVEPKLLFP